MLGFVPSILDVLIRSVIMTIFEDVTVNISISQTRKYSPERFSIWCKVTQPEEGRFGL